MAWGIDDQQARNVHVNVQKLFAFGHFFVQFLLREKSGTDLLSNTTSLAFLNVSTSNFVQKSRLACIDVSQNGAYGASELTLLSFEENTVISQNAAFFLFLQFLFLGFELLLCFFNGLLRSLLFWCIFLGFNLLFSGFGSLNFFSLLLRQVKTLSLLCLDFLFLNQSQTLLLLLLLAFFLLLLFS